MFTAPVADTAAGVGVLHQELCSTAPAFSNRCFSIQPENTVYGGPTAPSPKRVTLRTVQSKYKKQEPISMVTAYDYPSAVHVRNCPKCLTKCLRLVLCYAQCTGNCVCLLQYLSLRLETLQVVMASLALMEHACFWQPNVQAIILLNRFSACQTAQHAINIPATISDAMSPPDQLSKKADRTFTFLCTPFWQWCICHAGGQCRH